MGGWEGDSFADAGTCDEALAQVVTGMADLEQIAPFDTFWTYNNAGFYVAAGAAMGRWRRRRPRSVVHLERTLHKLGAEVDPWTRDPAARP